MAIPDCECIWGLPLNDKLDAIYCVFYQNAQSTVDLPTCECVKGMPLQDKVSAIFCALLQQGSGGGNIDPDQINGITPFGISAITGNPSASNILMTDAGGLLDSGAGITFSQISDAGPLLTGIQNATPPAGQAVLAADNSGFIYLYDGPSVSTFITGGVPPATSGPVSPVLAGECINGVLVSFS